MEVFINAIGAVTSGAATPLSIVSVIVICVLAFLLLRRYRRTQIIMEKIEKIDDETKFRTLREEMRSDSIKKFADVIEASQTLSTQEKAAILREVIKVHYGVSLRSSNNRRLAIIALTVGCIFFFYFGMIITFESLDTINSVVDSIMCGGSLFC